MSLAEPQPKRCIAMVAACPFPVPRGTPIRIIRMSEILAKRGHEVHVITYHLGDALDNPGFILHRIANVPTYRKTAPGPNLQKLLIVDPLLAWKVAQVVGNIRPDIIHAHHFEGLLCAVPGARLNHIPLIFDAHVLLHGELEYYKLALPHAPRRKIARYLDWRLPRLASHVVTVSDEIRQVLVQSHGIPEQDVSVIANGVESMFFDGDPARFPYGPKKRLLFTGNLAIYQGAERMLQTFARVAEQRDDVSLTVATDSDTGELMNCARRLRVDSLIDLVDCTVDELPHLIASADVALNPRTRCPGIPQKLLNYMAAGAAIVSFAGSAKYLRDGQNALVVEDDDVDAFADAISRLLDEPQLAERLRNAARNFAREHLSWEKNGTALENLYSELLREKNRAQ